MIFADRAGWQRRPAAKNKHAGPIRQPRSVTSQALVDAVWELQAQSFDVVAVGLVHRLHHPARPLLGRLQPWEDFGLRPAQGSLVQQQIGHVRRLALGVRSPEEAETPLAGSVVVRSSDVPQRCMHARAAVRPDYDVVLADAGGNMELFA